MSATTVALALELVIQLLGKSAEISALISKVQSEGRSELTLEEWSQVMNAYDAAHAKLEDAISAKKAEANGV